MQTVDRSAPAVSAQLDRILASASFRSSPRCQEFLRYVVTHAVNGQVEQLRERVIGVELYGRDPSYDKNEDSVVRVRATDVRRRLAQYYADESTAGELRIHLAAGSYVPEFHPSVPETPDPSPTGPAAQSRAVRIPWLWAGGLALAAVLIFFALPINPDRVVDRLWQPLWEPHAPVLIVVSSVPLYYWSQGDALKGEAGDDAEVLTKVPIPVPPGQVVSTSDLRSAYGKYTGIGITAAAVNAGGILARHNTTAMVRTSDRVTMDDLRLHPSLIIGGFGNTWALRFTKDLRFHLQQPEDGERVIDREGGREYRMTKAPDGEPTSDYPIVTRLIRSETGKPLVIASGMTQWGCVAASELATRPDQLAAALARVSNWENRNVQILSRVRIIRRTASQAEVLAVQVW
jgi:hypothetical protein